MQAVHVGIVGEYHVHKRIHLERAASEDSFVEKNVDVYALLHEFLLCDHEREVSKEAVTELLRKLLHKLLQATGSIRSDVSDSDEGKAEETIRIQVG